MTPYLDEYLTRMARHIHRTSVGRLSWEDLKQEGAIEIWRLNKEGETRTGVLKTASKRRMIDYMRSQRLYKREGAKHEFTEISSSDKFEFTDSVNSQVHNKTLSYDSVYEIEAIERNLCNTEIAEAISSLPAKQREYVTRRFFLQQPWKDMERDMGYNCYGLWSSKTGARNKLAEKLAHYKDLDV